MRDCGNGQPLNLTYPPSHSPSRVKRRVWRCDERPARGTNHLGAVDLAVCRRFFRLGLTLAAEADDRLAFETLIGCCGDRNARSDRVPGVPPTWCRADLTLREVGRAQRG